MSLKVHSLAAVFNWLNFGGIMSKYIKEKIKEFTELIEKYPEIKELYVYRAFLYEKTKQYKKAIEDYKKTLPKDYICFNIADICERNGLVKEAEHFYTKAINEDKNNIYNYIFRIHFYMRTKEIEKALLDCNTVLKLSPKEETILTIKRILTGE